MASTVQATGPDTGVHRRQPFRLGKAVPVFRAQEARRYPGGLTETPARGYLPDSRNIEDLKRKSFYVMSESGAELALGPELVTESAKVFRTAARLNHFISDALELPF